MANLLTTGPAPALKPVAQHLLASVLCLFSMFCVSAWLAWDRPLDAAGAAWPLLLVSVGALIVTYAPSHGVGGAGTLFMTTFALFHVGLVLAYVTSGASVLVGQGDNSWIQGTALRPAAFNVCLGMLAFSLFYRVSHDRLLRLGNSAEGRDVDPLRLRMVGGVAVIAGMLIVGRVLLSAGLSLNTGYGDFLEATADSAYGYGTLLFGLGSILLVQAGGHVRTLALIVFALVGSVLLVLGSRGAVIFTAVALVYLLTRQRRVSLAKGGAAVLLALGVVAVLRQTRLYGLRGLLRGEWSFNPLEGVAEMGYSLYPVVVVDQWGRTGTEPMGGLTLIAVPLRFLEGALGIVSPVPDMRLFNVEISQRVGAIGGSPIAEGLRNGGSAFVLALMGALGVLIAFIQTRHAGQGPLLGAALLLPLMFVVRNSFAPVPPQWAIGLLLVLFVSTGGKSELGRASSPPRKH